MMKKISFGNSIAFIFSFFAFTSLKCVTYYVSPSGNDSNSGTSQSSPWKSISKVNSMSFTAGSMILFEGGQIFYGGIYLDNLDGNDPANNMVISSYGTGKAIINSGNSFGFYSYNAQGFTVSELIFEGIGMHTNTADGVSCYTDKTGNTKLKNIQIKNIEVYGYGKTGIAIGSANGNTGYENVLIEGVHIHHVKENGIISYGFTSQSHTGWAHKNFIVKNCEVDNVPGYADASTHRGSGVILGQVDNGVIESCAAHDNGSANTHCGGPGGIWVWDCNNITIQYCESYRNSSGSGCDGLGFDLDGGVTNSTMQYNYSHDNDGAGYLLGQYDYARPWSDNTVRFNISENDGRTNAGGITLFKGPGTTMSGCKIYNNTIYITPSSANTHIGAFTVINWNTGITGIEVYNNIFQTTGGASLIDIPNGYSAAFKGNLYWSTGGAFKIKYQGSTYSSIAAWRTSTGNEQNGTAPTGFTADPLLKNPGNGTIMFPNPAAQLDAYKLGASSPAIDAGLNLLSLFSVNAGSNDFFTNPLNSGSAPDIGAHESSSGVTTETSLVRESVKEKFVVYFPNPVRSGELIFVRGAALPYSAELVSITGAKVWQNEKIDDKEFGIPTINLTAGPYILITKDADGVKTAKKIIVQ